MNYKKISFYFLLISAAFSIPVSLYAQNADITSIYEKYSFSYNQVPDNLISSVLVAPGTTFQWGQSSNAGNAFTNIPGATNATLSFTAPLTQTTYFLRNATLNGNTIYSNVIKLELVSANWENINYVREHDILIPGQTDWKVIDQLPIGSKLQTTTYMDGLGRPIQKVSRETAPPPSNPGDLWGDVIKFNDYDLLGRQPKDYLPYTTTVESGKYKTTPLIGQPQYYTNVYNETSAYNAATFDNSPLNSVLTSKSPGTSWAAGPGNNLVYELNDASDNVQIWHVTYNTGDLPINEGAYPELTLYKTKSTNESGKQVIEYTDFSGRSILKKTQADDNPSAAHAGWICVYSIYDDFGLLRYQLQPEAVKYLDNNNWSFAGTNGQQVFDELCFRYEYDDKGRLILKKAPGAAALRMIYDERDRIVFMQDGNQALQSLPEWTTNIYDELDRPVLRSLYKTAKTVANLQSDLTNAPGVSNVTIAAQSITVATYKNPISSADLNNTSVSTVIKYNFYDSYNYTGVKAFNSSFDNTLAYPTGAEAIAKTQRTVSFPTGNMVRVLGTATFLSSTSYYDEKGRPIQTTEDNIKTGTDVTTSQYQWDGRLLSSNTKHTAAGTGYTAFSIVTKNNFDKIGRVISIEKKFGSNAFKMIGEYKFDDLGRLKTKRLDPGYTGTGKQEIEMLNYSYNLHDEITGINKDYALKNGNYNKWDNFFGMYLGYDNKDNVFAAQNLDGHATGILWSTQGDDAQRKYDFTYDNAGRLTAAVFTEKEKPSDIWNTQKMNVSVGGNGAGGTINYDLNGNILSMIQKGVLPGNATVVNADNLSYTYSNLSNKLIKVSDNGTLGANNGKLGDFADGSNGGDDYVYDANGNLVIDLNKGVVSATGGTSTALGITGIKYNYLDKAEEIRIPGKGTVKIVYDADGNKLQKLYTPESSGVTKTTSYINEYVYEDNNLQYINFEEGRLRVVQTVSQNNGFDYLTLDGNIDLPGSKRGAYDFFVRDYQSNVRVILTEEIHTGGNSCSMETNRAANEEPVFGQAGGNNEVSATRITKPSGWAANTSASVSKLGNLAAKKVGPNVLLKVMAGDLVSSATQYYYQNPVTNSAGSNNLITSILGSLVGAISGSSVTNSITKDAAANISSTLGSNGPFSLATAPDASNPSGTNPKAYLTVLFFDERFNFVSEGSTAQRVQQAGDNASPLVIANLKAPKNGYAYVYISNESDEPVYFDNFQVTHNRGRITEENHYYAYGLRIAAISSRKIPDPNEGGIKNNNLYNDKELWDDGDLNWYDYGFRNYDAQIGRFTQLDPLTSDYPELTNYQYASCDPISNVDVDGLEGAGVLTASEKAYSYTAFAVTNRLAPVAAKATLTFAQTVNYGARFASGAIKQKPYDFNAKINLPTPTLDDAPARRQIINGKKKIEYAIYDSSPGESGSYREGGNSLVVSGEETPGANANQNIKARHPGNPINMNTWIQGQRLMDATPTGTLEIHEPWDWAEMANKGKEGMAIQFEENEKEKPLKYKGKPASGAQLVKDTAPSLAGEYSEYIMDKNGKLIRSTYTSGLGDTIINGKDGAPDTLRTRPIRKPTTVPKRNIIPKK